MCNADWKFSFAASKSSENNSKDSTENDVSSSTNIDTNDDDSENNTTISIDDNNKNDSSVNTDDGNNKNNTNVNTDNDNDINNTSINTGDNNENNTNVNTGNDNGKNDTSAGTNNGKIPDEDVKHDIRIITQCMIRSKGMGNLVMHITRLTKIVFFVVPSLRNPFINYYYDLFEFLFKRLMQLKIWLQYLEAIIRRNLPYSESILFPWKFKLKDYSNLFNYPSEYAKVKYNMSK